MNNPRATMNGKPVFSVPAKTIINFKSHFDKKLLCDGITFTAGDACAYSCSFCYVDSMMKKREEWLKEHGVTGDHMNIVVRRDAPVEIARKQIMSKPMPFRMKKQIIYASPLVDVAANMELVRETVEICKVILELTNWDIRLLSKSNLLPKVAVAIANEIQSMAMSARIIYGVSTGTLDDNLAAAFEQGTAKVSKRIESLHWLQDNGFRTFGMICPSLPQADYLGFSRDMANALRVEKCEHIWAEVINVRGESFTRTYDALKSAGYEEEAERIKQVSEIPWKWQGYANDTFIAHKAYIPSSKLRFLQYVTKETRPFWESEKSNGAVIL